MMAKTVAGVILPIPMDTIFNYIVPPEFIDEIEIGKRVKVPFGKRERVGIICSVNYKPATTKNLKSITLLLDEKPLLTEESWAIAHWFSDYYSCSLGESLWALFPKKWKIRKEKPKEELKPIKQAFFKPTSAQKRAILAINSAIKNETKKDFLLYGIASSGKTEVYLHAIREVLKKGKQVIYLIPEISLTPQTFERLRERFGDQVALWHSHMTDRERFIVWQKIVNNEISILIGPRSAMLAPFKNIGLIIIDEEQEDSYKQDQKPCYDARTLALWRTEYHNAVLVIGSATPRITTFHQKEKGLFEYLELPEKIGHRTSPKTDVLLVDMKLELNKKNFSVISYPLKEAIKKSLKNREQIILFLNRRGDSTHVFCRNCGHVMKCPHCDISLVYHSDNNKLICHYCGYNDRNPTQCPACSSSYIKYFGAGLQKIETEVKKLFPDASLARLDKDTSTKKGYLEKIYNDFKNNKIDILLGTQIIAKGLDFENVTLVGVISSDTALNLPDFRASERTFSLLVQVLGRTGRRDKESQAIIQTYYFQNPAIRLAASMDYQKFYNTEIKWRKQLKYPPFVRLVTITLRGPVNDKVKAESERLMDFLKQFETKDTEIIGPFQPRIARKYKNFRWQILIKKKLKTQTLLNKPLKFLKLLRTNYRPHKTVKISIDPDPINIL